MESVAKILTTNQKHLKDASYIGYDDENDTVLIVCPHEHIEKFQKIFSKYGNQSIYYEETETGAVIVYI
jgi:hypothetical protein